MKNTSSLVLLGLGAWLTVACAGPAQQSASPQTSNLQQALTQAASAYKKAYAVEYAWRDTEELLNAAKEAAAKGEADKAMELARQVKLEGEMAYAQYLASKKAGPKY